MRLSIKHATQYRYDAPNYYGLQQIRLTPHSSRLQKVVDWKVSFEGGWEEVRFKDQHANSVILARISSDQTVFEVACEGVVETHDTAGVLGAHEELAPLWYFQRTTALTKPGERVRALLGGDLQPSGGRDLSSLHALSEKIAEVMPYEIGATSASTSAEQALEIGKGVCQDHAQVFIAAARLLGFPARYVSGYLTMPDRVTQDAGHAWAEAHVEGLGWVGFDVSNAVCPDERYVRIATGLDYAEAAPVSGILMGTQGESLSVTLQIQQ